MNELYQRIMELCDGKEISGYKLCKDLALQPSFLTDLKMGRQSGISAKKAAKIADYLGVSVEYLLTGEDRSATDVAEQLQLLRTRPELRSLLNVTKHMTPDQVRSMIALISTMKEG